MYKIPHSKFCLLVIFLFGLNSLQAQDKSAYSIFNPQGERSNYQKMLEELSEADIVLFGELHNNPICHWLQLETTQSIWAKRQEDLILGAEMFEADDQVIIDEYLAGLIELRHLKQEAKVWDNFDTDYLPLLNIAKEHQLTFVASNVPRRYASLVSRQGLDALSKLSKGAKEWIAPLPIKTDLSLPAYAQMIEMMKGGHMGGRMSPENFAYAQAIKDATMAHFILQNWQKGKMLIHFNGTYHSDNYESIIWYLKQQQPNLKIRSISSVEQDQIQKLEPKHRDKADFIIVIPETMTKTY